MKTNDFEAYLNALMKPEAIKDYCPNGLQIQGSDNVAKVVTGVTASQALIDAAIEQNADAIIVHHGYFWKSESYVIRGMKYNRIKALMDNDINLFAYHLPLDVHSDLGNNAQLGKHLGFENIRPLEEGYEQCLILRGELSKPMSGAELKRHISESLDRECLHIDIDNNKLISTIAWCTGGAQGYIDQVAEHQIDAFISGEISEQTTHSAKEQGVHYFAAGHHATEVFGVKALAEYLAQHTSLDVQFIDIDNPA